MKLHVVIGASAMLLGAAFINASGEEGPARPCAAARADVLEGRRADPLQELHGVSPSR